MTKKEISKYMSEIGKLGGESRSKAKLEAVRKNGSKGGRPPKNKNKKKR